MSNTLRRQVLFGSGAAMALPVLAPFAASEVAGLEAGLLQRVFGQDHVIAAVAGAIRRAAFGAPLKDGPVSFLFLGPRAVGKTQLAKALAGQLFGTDDALLRVDLTKRTALDLGELAQQAVQRRVILLDEADRTGITVYENVTRLLRGELPPEAAGLHHAVVIVTSGAGAVGPALTGAPPALRGDLLAALHETVTFRQIDWRQFRPKR